MDRHREIDDVTGRRRGASTGQGQAPYLARLTAAASLRSYYDDPSNCSAVIDALSRIVVSKSIKLLSIDVFDTALLRSTKSELGRFCSVSERFHTSLSNAGTTTSFAPEDVLLARIIASRAAYGMRRDTTIGGDPSLDAIAGTVCALLNLPDTAALYAKTELECETRDVSLNPLIAGIRDRFPGLRLVFLSDMYLGSRQISKILTAKNISSRRPKVYSSADGHGSKAGGGMFEHVARSLRVPPCRALHIGDNLESDYRGAKRCGWQSLYLPLPDEEIRARRQCFARIRARIDRFAGGLRPECGFTP
ncbi:HAD-IA family hydrolase [Nisaea sp.]|uniref:HAD-IA family hydrolase n=1 Tax=Nisaea sp. TaxID=2024842 RepID=UPI0032EB8C45